MIIMVFDPFGTPFFFPSADFIRIYPQLDSAFRPGFFFFLSRNLSIVTSIVQAKSDIMPLLSQTYI